MNKKNRLSFRRFLRVNQINITELAIASVVGRSTISRILRGTPCHRSTIEALLDGIEVIIQYRPEADEIGLILEEKKKA